jgi:hypothetical protein
MALHGEFAGIAEFAPARLTQRAVSVAAAVAQGRSMKEKEEVAVSVKESPPTAAVPHMHSLRKSARAEEAKQGNE